MKDLIADLIENPCRETYLPILEGLSASSKYDPYSIDLKEVIELVGKKRFEEARLLLKAGFPNLLASPAAHWMHAAILENAGNLDAAEFEMEFAHACAQGILGTGDGTRELPYRVLRVSDEYDVLRVLGKIHTKQRLVQSDEKYCDVLTCEDGSELWFDVSLPFQFVQRKRKG